MIDLLEAYSVSDILVFILMLGLAIKGTVSFWDWAVDRLRKAFNKETVQQKKEETIEAHFQRDDELLKRLSQNQNELRSELKMIQDNITLLLVSDKDDIKSWITEKHHFYCYGQKWIDDYSLECIEKRYDHYKDEGGNSFIKELMDEIRKLPKLPDALDN